MFKEIIVAIKANEVTEVNIRYFDLSPEQLKELIAALQENTSVIKISLLCTNITPDQITKDLQREVAVAYADHVDYGDFLELYAQIWSDSEIVGSRFEGNFRARVIPAFKTLLQDVRDTPLNAYISQSEDYATLQGIITPDLVGSILVTKPDETIIDGLLVTLKKNGTIALACGVERHAIIIEFVANEDSFEINIYNTGMGLKNHSSQQVDGERRYHACKRHTINLSAIPPELREAERNKILQLALPETRLLQRMGRTLADLYSQYEKIVLAYPASTIDDNDSSLIIGQRSGTCVWKSIFRYAREKVKHLGANKNLDLLLKYDLKMRSLLSFREKLRYNQDLKITKEFIRALRFACQNGYRLSLKMAKQGLITGENLQVAFTLYTELLDAIPQLEERVSKDLVYTLPVAKGYLPEIPFAGLQKYRSLPETKEYRAAAEFIAAAYPVATFTERCESLHSLSTNIAAGNATVADVEYVLKSCIEIEPLDFEQTIRLFADLYNVAKFYMQQTHRDAAIGFTEKRYLTMVRINLLAVQLCERFLPIKGKSSTIYPAIMSAFEYVQKHRIIIDPELRKEFIEFRQRLENFGYQFAVAPFEYDVNPVINELYDNEDSVSKMSLLFDLLNISCLANSMPGISIGTESAHIVCKDPEDLFGGLLLINNTEKLFAFIKKYRDTQWYPSIKFTFRRGGFPDYGPGPVDLYTLTEVTSVFSRGFVSLLNHFNPKQHHASTRHSTRIDAPEYSYVPRARKLLAEESRISLLQSMFSEHGTSIQRITEFIRDNFPRFGEQSYIDIVILRLFTDNPLDRDLSICPENVLKLLQYVASLPDQNFDAYDSLSKRALFPLQIYYIVAWYVLNFLDECKDPEIRSAIEDRLRNADLLKYLDFKLANYVATDANLDLTYAQLLSLKLIHYQIQIKLKPHDFELNDLEVIKSIVLLNFCPDLPGFIAESSKYIFSGIFSDSAKIARFMDENGLEIAKLVAVQLDYADADITDCIYEPEVSRLQFRINGVDASYNLKSGTSVVGDGTYIKIPKTFLSNELFKDIFKPLPTRCIVVNENLIKFSYKGHEYNVFFISNSLFVQIGDYQYDALARAGSALFTNYYARFRNPITIPFTIIDGNHEIFHSEKDNVSMVLNKTDKQKLYTIDLENKLIRREHDQAILIVGSAPDIYPAVIAFKSFEHEVFTEIWQLPNGEIEINLPRYNIRFTFDPNLANLLKFISPEEKVYEICSDHLFSLRYPNGVLLKDQNGERFAFLPKQTYIYRSSELDTREEAPPIMFDIVAALWLKDQNNEDYKDVIGKTHLFKYANTAGVVKFNFSNGATQCNTPAEYFYLAYYLLGQDEFLQARECLLRGFALSGVADITDPWLVKILDSLPVAIETLQPPVSQKTIEPVFNLKGTQHTAIKLLAVYFAFKTSGPKQRQTLYTILRNGVSIAKDYYANLRNDNIPVELQLTNVQELELLTFLGLASPVLLERYHALKVAQEDLDYETYRQTNSRPEIKEIDLKIELQPTKGTDEFHMGSIFASDDLLFRGFYEPTIPFNVLLHFLFENTAESSLAKAHIYTMIQRSLVIKERLPMEYYWLLYLQQKYAQDPGYKQKFKEFISANEKKFARFTVNDFILVCLRLEQEDAVLEGHTLTMKVPSIEFTRENTFIIPDGPKQRVNISSMTIDLREFLPVADTAEHATIAASSTELEYPAWLQGIPDAAPAILEYYADDYRAGRSRDITPQFQTGAVGESLTADEAKPLEDEILQLFNKTVGLEQQSKRESGGMPLFAFHKILHLFIQQDKKLFMRHSFLSEQECDELNKKLFKYLFLLTGGIGIQRAYTADDAPRLIAICLLFEKEAKIRLSTLQVENIRHILDTESYPNAVVQMLMGMGKTKVMSPILAVANADGDNLSIYVTPKTLFDTTVANLKETTTRVFGKSPSPIVFEREHFNLQYLRQILAQLQAARSDRNYVIMSPDTIHSLHLSRVECALRNVPVALDKLDVYASNEEYEHNKACKEVLDEIFKLLKKHGVCIVDEIDQVLELNTEYNYASEDYKQLDQKFPVLQNVVLDLYALLSKVPLRYVDNSALDIITGLARIPLTAEWPDLLSDIAEQLYKEFLSSLAIDKKTLIQVLLGKIPLADIAEQISEQVSDILAVLKFELTDLLRITVGSAELEEYGPRKAQAQTFDDLLAIPHVQLRPKEGAEFTDPIITINYTIQAFLDNKQFVELKLLTNYIADLIREYNVFSNEQDRKAFKEKVCAMLGIVEADSFDMARLSEDSFKKQFCESSNSNITLKMYLLKMYILPNLIENEYEIQSSAFNFAYIFKNYNGFSGTIENPDTFHESLQFANKDKSFGTDGAVISLVEHLNPSIMVAAHESTAEQQIVDLIHSNAQRGTKLHALIDVGAAFKTMGSNLKITKVLARELQKYEAYKKLTHILFFQGNALQAYRISDGKIFGIKETSATPDQYFTFYDQSHTTGIDIDHAVNAHAVVTLGEVTKKSKLMQGIMRMRGLRREGTQSIEIFVSSLAAQKEPDLSTWTLVDVLRFVVENSIRNAEEMNFTAAVGHMQHYLFERIAHLALDSGKSAQIYRDVLISKPIATLFERYGSYAELVKARAALDEYLKKILEIASYHHLDLEAMQEYCKGIINRFVEKCAEEISTNARSTEVSDTKHVTKAQSKTDMQNEQEDITNLQNSATRAPKFDVLGARREFAGWSNFWSSRLFRNIFDEAEMEPMRDISVLERNKAKPAAFAFSIEPFNPVLCYQYAFRNFYRASDDAPEHLKHVTVNAYYLAIVKAPTGITHVLLDEIDKTGLIAKVSNCDGNGWDAAHNIPPDTTISIYTKHGASAYSNAKSVPEIDLEVFISMYLFNADVALLNDILAGPNANEVHRYFAVDNDKKLKYLHDKVLSFRRDQMVEHALFQKAIAAGPGAKIAHKQPQLSQVSGGLAHYLAEPMLHTYARKNRSKSEEFEADVTLVAGEGERDSFALAVGVDRDQIIRYALDNLKHKWIRDLLAPEIYAYQLEVAQQNNPKAVLEASALVAAVNDCNIILRRAPNEFLNASQLKSFFSDPLKQEAFSLACQTFIRAERALTTYCNNRVNCEQYLSERYVKGDILPQSAMIDIVARKLHRTIVLHLPNNGTHITHSYGQMGNELHLNYKDRHFTRVKAKQSPMV